MPNRTLERTRLKTPLSSMVLDGVPSTVSWHWASLRESAKFPISVKEVVVMFMPPRPNCTPPPISRRSLAQFPDIPKSLRCLPFYTKGKQIILGSIWIPGS